MVSGVRLVGGGLLLLALLTGCATSSRRCVPESTCCAPAPEVVTTASAPPAAPEPLGDESLQASDKQIDKNIDQVLAARGVTKEEVIAMTEAHVEPGLIINHIRSRGATDPLSTNDLILLQQRGVHAQVIAAMQKAAAPEPRRVLVRDHYIPTIVGVRPFYGPRAVYYRVE